MTASSKQKDRRPVNSVVGRCEKKGTRENSDVGFVRDRTFEVIYILMKLKFSSCLFRRQDTGCI